MKKLILTVAMVVSGVFAMAQGVVTVENLKEDLPLDQWFVARDKDLKDQMFFYANHELTMEELKSILSEHEQDIDTPKGQEGTADYWVILKENEYKVYVYLDKFEDNFSMITLVTLF